MRRIVICSVVLGFVLLVASVAVAASLERVVDRPGVNEFIGAGSDSYFVWSANSKAHPNRYNDYIRPIGGSGRTRINPPGTQGYGPAIDGTTVVYGFDRGDGNLGLYEASTGDRSKLPGSVNTDYSEYRPTISGDWLLFSRSNSNRKAFDRSWTKVILFNKSTKETRVLRKVHNGGEYLVSDQVNGDRASFEYCRYRHGEYSHCDVFLYQISTKSVSKVPNPGVQQYAGGLSTDGTLYFVRTGSHDHWVCGHRTRIIRYPLGGPGVVIATLRDGFDALNTFAHDESGGSTTLYLNRARCSTEQGGMYRISNADAAS